MSRKPTESEVKYWFDLDNPQQFRNIAVVTGAVSNLAVLDFDDEVSYKMFKDVCFTDTMTVSTGKGYHVYFRPDIHAKTTTFQLNGNLHHIKQEGGYVVAPPSIHYSGRTYSFTNRLDPAFISLESVAGFLKHIGAERYIDKREERSPTWASDLCTQITSGGRNTAAAQLTGLLIRYFKNDPGLIEGLMYAWNKTYCDPPMSDEEIKQIVRGEYLRYGK